VTLATLLSAFPGLGQVYMGYVGQGFFNAILVASLITLLASDLGALTPLAALFMAFYWLYNIIDANRKAVLYNEKVLGLPPGELPEDSAAGFQGSVGAGVLLIVVGGLALAHTRFAIPMAWVQNWWPAALVGAGAWLIWKAVARNAKD
jgi:TM2 domain-containing membrane protein YozV